VNATAKFLMVDPAHYEVRYRINPWMQPEQWMRDAQGLRAAARRAYDALRCALREAGCDVVVADGAPGLPDMVFPANAGIILDGRALLARFRYPQRRGEEAAFLAVFEQLREQGLLKEIARFPPGCFQEGAGDAIWDVNRRCFWAAYGPRSARESLAHIADFFDQEVVPLELASERCYHLDVCFCPLSGGEILYYPPALTRPALRRLRERVPVDMLLAASDEDLGRFSVNAVNVGRRIVMAAPTPRLGSMLRERGYSVIPVDLEPFKMSGGGAYCMTLRLDRSSLPAVAARVGDREAAWA